jgi:NADPH2:quinone reductase
MRALVFDRFGEPAEVLKLRNVEPPQLGPGEVRVRVLKRFLHRADLSRIRGQFPGEVAVKGGIPGGDGFGIIESVGDGVGGDKDMLLGRRVAFFPVPRAWAEYVVAPVAFVVPVPDDISDEIAPLLLVNSFTALNILRAVETCVSGRLGASTPLLVTAAGSSVARMLTIFARLRGQKVVATVRSRDTAAVLAARLPGVPVISTSDDDWKEQVRAAAGGGVQVAIDPIGGPIVNDLIELLSDGGTLIQYGGLDGRATTIPPLLLPSRALTLLGVSLRRWMRTSTRQQREQDIADTFAIGRAAPEHFDVLAEYDLANIKDAINATETPGRTGAVVLTSAA